MNLVLVVPAKAGTQYAAVYREGMAYWIPGLAALARDDGFSKYRAE